MAASRRLMASRRMVTVVARMPMTRHFDGCRCVEATEVDDVGSRTPDAASNVVGRPPFLITVLQG